MGKSLSSSEIDTLNPDEIPGKLKAKTATQLAGSLGIGHNKKPRHGGVAVDQLKSIIGRVETLEEEKAGIAADISDVYAEAKGNGFDIKAIRTIIKLRKMDAQERDEAETILETYKRALGMQPDFFDEEKTEP